METYQILNGRTPTEAALNNVFFTKIVFKS